MSGQPAALAALRAALAARLAADGPLAAMVSGRIHDGTPRAAVMPYLALGDGRCRDVAPGVRRASLAVEAVTADEGRERAEAIAGRAVEAALAAPLEPEGVTLVLLRLDTTAVTRLKDGCGWRATAVLDALVDG